MEYVEGAEPTHSGYLHKLYRRASRTIGNLASFACLVICMHIKSTVPGEDRVTLSLKRLQLHQTKEMITHLRKNMSILLNIRNFDWYG